MINTLYCIKVSGSEEKGNAMYAVTFPDGTGKVYILPKVPDIVYTDILQASKLIDREEDYVLSVDNNGLSIVKPVKSNDPKVIEKMQKLFSKMPLTQLQWYASKKQVIGVVASSMLEAVNVSDLDVMQKKDLARQVAIAAKTGYNQAQAKAGGKILESLGITLPKLTIAPPTPVPVVPQNKPRTPRAIAPSGFDRVDYCEEVELLKELQNKPRTPRAIAPSGFDRVDYCEEVELLKELQSRPLQMTATIEPVVQNKPPRRPRGK